MKRLWLTSLVGMTVFVVMLTIAYLLGIVG